MKLFIYDHCPYCDRARMGLGLNGMAWEPVILLNDDEMAVWCWEAKE